MTPLQIIITLSGIIFFIFAIDSYQRKRFNALHFLVFFGGSGLLVLFSTNIELLNKFGSFFGLNRGADLVVYTSIIILFYLYFELINKTTKQSILTTRIITEQSIQKGLGFFEIENLKLEDSKFKDYIFLIRSYNEAKTLPAVIDEIFQKGFSKILIVNDGSNDDTVKLVLKKKEQYKSKDIILISHLINRGGGAANKTGFEFLSRYGETLDIRWVVTYDADGQMDIGDMDSFMIEIDKKNDRRQLDILLGSRFISGGKAENIPMLRRIILFGSRLITYMFNSFWVTDPHNGYRVISLDAIRKIRIDSDGMTYASELLEEIKKNKLRYAEVPVNIKYTDYSLSKGQKNSNAFKILGELIYKKFFYK